MKDSQDWLDDWIKKVEGIWSVAYANAPRSEDGVEATYMKKAIKELERDAKSAIREHFLKEALEMIDSTPKLILKGKFEDDMGLFGDYVEIAELRNKFNDKYKED